MLEIPVAPKKKGGKTARAASKTKKKVPEIEVLVKEKPGKEKSEDPKEATTESVGVDVEQEKPKEEP